MRAVRHTGEGVALELENGSAVFDHVVLGTGYKIDVAKLGIFARSLIDEIVTVNGSPQLGRGLESSVAGLHFVGATAVHSFGPLMRFVWGAGFAAQALTSAVAGNCLPTTELASSRAEMALKVRPSQTPSS